VNSSPSKRSFDPLSFVVVVAAALIYSLHGFQESFDREAAIFAYGGQQILNGVPPYASVFNVIGPLGHILAAPGVMIARWFGFDEILGMRLVFLALASLTVGVVYLLVRSLFGSRPVAMAAAAGFLTFESFLHYATAGPREKTAMVLFVTLALLGAVQRRWVLAGAAGSLAVLAWQPAFVIAVALVLAALALSRRRWHALRNLMVGASIPLIAITTYFAAEGAFAVFVDGFGGVGLRALTLALPRFPDRLAFIAELAVKHGLLSTLVFTSGLLGMIATMVWRISGSRGVRHLRDDPFLVAVIGFPLGVAWTLYNFQGAPDLLLLLPFSAIGVGTFCYLATRRLDTRKRWMVGATVTIVAVAVTAFTAIDTREERLLEQRRSVDRMLAQLPPNGDVLSIGAPQVMVLSGEVNPNPYLSPFLAPTAHLIANWPGGMSGFVDHLAADPPAAIAFRGTPRFDDPDGLNAELSRWISENYVGRGRAPGWQWLVRRDLASEIEAVDAG
jgi:hypothetical protein